MSVHIAIPEPTSPLHVEDSAAYNQRSLPQYLHALYSAGATPIPIPLHESPQRVAKILATCQGILLPGSPADIDPRNYGESALPETAPPDPARAAIDKLLLEDAFRLGKPILGICQGTQALNVWRGGTLLQDIPSQIGLQVDHSPGRGVLEAHPVQITPNTRLAALLTTARAAENSPRARQDEVDFAAMPEYVNSSHHQAICAPGDGLIVAARCPQDGIVEAVELRSAEHFVVAVQWHPERSYDASAFSRAIFAGFLQASASWTQKRVEASAVPA